VQACRSHLACPHPLPPPPAGPSSAHPETAPQPPLPCAAAHAHWALAQSKTPAPNSTLSWCQAAARWLLLGLMNHPSLLRSCRTVAFILTRAPASDGAKKIKTMQLLYSVLNVRAACCVCRATELWLPDLAWAAGVKGFAAMGASTAQHAQTTYPQPTAAAAAAAAAGDPAPCHEAEQHQGKSGTCSTGGSANMGGDVTWRRLHAMGPTALLKQQMELGLLASLSTTQ